MLYLASTVCVSYFRYEYLLTDLFQNIDFSDLKSWDTNYIISMDIPYSTVREKSKTL